MKKEQPNNWGYALGKMLRKQRKLNVPLAGFAGLAVAAAGYYMLASNAAQNPASDLNNDKQVNVFDLSILLGRWNQTGINTADLNGDSKVNVLDLSILLSSWGMTIAPTPPPPTPPPPPGACTLKPNATNIGATGTLTTNNTTSDLVLGNGQTLQNVNLPNAGIIVDGTNVTVRNVKTNGIFVRTSGGAMIDRVTSNDGFAISSSQNITVQYSIFGPTSADGMHVTSDSGSMNSNISLAYNYIHTPQVEPDAHYDGIQVRGVNGMTINCSVYDAGPYQDMWNAQIYLEDANGGNSNVTVSNNWLYGGAFSVMLDYGSNNKLINNRLDGDIHWDYCYVDTNSQLNGFVSTGNVDDSSGQPINLCL